MQISLANTLFIFLMIKKFQIKILKE